MCIQKCKVQTEIGISHILTNITEKNNLVNGKLCSISDLKSYFVSHTGFQTPKHKAILKHDG